MGKEGMEREKERRWREGGKGGGERACGEGKGKEVERVERRMGGEEVGRGRRKGGEEEEGEEVERVEWRGRRRGGGERGGRNWRGGGKEVEKREAEREKRGSM